MSKIEPGTWIRHGNPAASYAAYTTDPTLVTDGIPVDPEGDNVFATVGIRHTAAGARSFDIKVFGYVPAVYSTAAGAVSAIAASGAWLHLATFVYPSGATDENDAHFLRGLGGFTRLAAKIENAVGAPTVTVDFCLNRA